MMVIRLAIQGNVAARPSFSASFRLNRSSSCCFYTSLAAAVHAKKAIREGPRNDWARDEIKSIYDSLVLDLLFHGVSTTTHLFSAETHYN
ncbi:hypothetical protein CDL15_Pgr016549 [Punica granatum]|uniref:Uncharacterized protein n=1 Tax=Punica granatum TaxID=22663 RepID=A0A218WJA5_PUNGR|nr:hypothetical protein CDL15_Pgr016549 [Punica granatum]PKI77760.1 hypothetical protein CRG98_001884 [Punica granatum]